MNGALILALVASALVGVSTANPDPLAALLAPLTAQCQSEYRTQIPEVTQCGGDQCTCADTSACATDQDAVICVLKEMGLWDPATGQPTPAGVALASAQTGIQVTIPATLATLVAEAKMINEQGCALSNWCDAVEANPKCALKPLIGKLYEANDAACGPAWRTAALPSVCTVQHTIMTSAAIAGQYGTTIAGLIGIGAAVGEDCLTVDMYIGAEDEAARAEDAVIAAQTPEEAAQAEAAILSADSKAFAARACLLELAAKLDAGC